ncbi:MAG: hypothetical protein RLZZ336_2072 [Cyanobacteriota bacterium]
MVLLIDAVINRQADLTQRLGQQWIHRHGLRAFETLSRNRLLPVCGDDGINWLHDQLGLPTRGHEAPVITLSEPEQPGPAALPLASLIREALNEALQPLRQDSVSEPKTQPLAATAAADPWRLPTSPAGDSPSRDAAPPPAGLAALRAWLHSDAA